MGNKHKKTNAMRVLEKAGMPYTVQAYTYNSDQLDVGHIATENQLPLEQIYKTLVLKGDKTGPLVALVNGADQLQLKKVAQASNNKKVSLLPIPTLPSITGYIRGGCSPIGMKRQLPTYLDQQAVDLPYLYINAGVRGLLLRLSPSDLHQVVPFTYAALV